MREDKIRCASCGQIKRELFDFPQNLKVVKGMFFDHSGKNCNKCKKRVAKIIKEKS